MLVNITLIICIQNHKYNPHIYISTLLAQTTDLSNIKFAQALQVRAKNLNCILFLIRRILGVQMLDTQIIEQNNLSCLLTFYELELVFE